MGDMMALNNLPGVAEVAMQGGLHAANTIMRRQKGEPSLPFKYRDLGSVATIGRFKAIVSVHGVRLSGFPGLGCVGLCPPGFPYRFRQPGDDDPQVDPFQYWPRPAGA